MRLAVPRAMLIALSLAPILGVASLHAQAEASIEAIAPVLAAADARAWDDAAIRRGLSFPDSIVRMQAALAAGRIGDPAAVPLLVPVLDDTSASVRAAAAFALGLVRDSAAVAPLVRRMTAAQPLDAETGAEIVTALARIGGRGAADFFAAALADRDQLAVEPAAVRPALVLESWRLGRLAPVPELLPFMGDSSEDLRWRAAYALGRLRHAARPVGERLPAMLSDQSAFVRANAARGLHKGFADSAGVAPGTLADLLGRALTDADPQVRIGALRSLGTYRRAADASRVASLLDDPQVGVAMQAVETLGEIGGPEASTQLAAAVATRKSFAMRRAALVALAQVDTAAFARAGAGWSTSKDWRERAAVAGASAQATGDAGAPAFLQDPDGRVVASALEGWGAHQATPSAALVTAARARLSHPDVMVRTHSAAVLGKAPDAADVPALGELLRRSARDSIPDAGLAALEALASIARSGPAAEARVATEFVGRAARPDDYLVRRWAEENWPALSERWGPATPIATGRTPLDYRDLARRFTLPSSPDRAVHVTIDIDQKGVVELELFGPEAPLTVANFLLLVDRRYFDGLRFHRAVPNFVVQDGDPRGDGNGGPGHAIRDEINRKRYGSSVIGMALSGPDTGGSQWFINLSPQPHLDGIYTVFGRVVSGQHVLQRVVQGDLIRSVRR
jgi:cyclophilin family peptidyl-prolyl cis-trans isomerase/HEAT repeat protein